MGQEISSLPNRVALCYDEKWFLIAEEGKNIRATEDISQYARADAAFKIENDKKLLETWLSESDGADLLSVIFIRSDHHPQRCVGVSKERHTVNISVDWSGPGPEHRWVMERPGGGGEVVQTPQLDLGNTEFLLISRYVGRDLALRGGKLHLEVDEATGLLVLRKDLPETTESLASSTQRCWKFVSLEGQPPSEPEEASSSFLDSLVNWRI